MSRDKLVDIANRFTAWISSHDLDPSTPSSFISPNVVLHVPFPGLSPDFAGLLGQHERTIKATNDMKVVVKETSVDETNCMVTQFFEVTGTQTGEWIGIPATGKPYKITGFGMVKVDLASGLITDYWSIIQDLALLVQLGVVPMPGGS